MANARYKYQTNKGSVFFVIADNDPELDSIRGPNPAGTPTEFMTIKASKNANEGGIKPRQAVLYRTIGTPTTGTCSQTTGKAFKHVPILTQSVADGLTIGQTYSINGVTYTLQAISREKVN